MAGYNRPIHFTGPTWRCVSPKRTAQLTDLIGSDYAQYITEVEDMLCNNEPIRAKFGIDSCQSKYCVVNHNRHHGDYCYGRVYKQGLRRRIKADTRVNYIY